jgi:hypothetical protein
MEVLLNSRDELFILLGLASCLWCIGLSLYVIITTSAKPSIYVRPLVASFSLLLIDLGERLRRESRLP